MSAFQLCGAVITETGDIEDMLVHIEKETGKSELVYNNEPYGYVSIYGLKGLNFKPIRKEIKELVDGMQVTRMSDEYEYFITAITSKVRGNYKAFAMLEDGILAISEFSPFVAVKQSVRLGEEPDEKYEGYVDVTDVDEESEDFAELYEIFSGC